LPLLLPLSVLAVFLLFVLAVILSGAKDPEAFHQPQPLASFRPYPTPAFFHTTPKNKVKKSGVFFAPK